MPDRLILEAGLSKRGETNLLQLLLASNSTTFFDQRTVMEIKLSENPLFQDPITDERKQLAIRIWVDEFIIAEKTEKLPLDNFYKSYKSWVQDNDIKAVDFETSAPFSKAFTKVLAEKGLSYTRRRQRGQRTVCGISFSEKATLTFKEKDRERELQKLS